MKYTWATTPAQTKAHAFPPNVDNSLCGKVQFVRGSDTESALRVSRCATCERSLFARLAEEDWGF